MSPKISKQEKEQRRSKLLKAARQVFIDKGYEPATFKDIVEKADISRGGIYLYFQTKEEIFVALLDLQDREYGQYIDRLIDEEARIWDVVKISLIQSQNDLLLYENGSLLPAFYEYFLTGWRDEQRRSRLVQRYEDGMAHFARLLQTGVDRGEFTPSLPIEHISRIAASFQEGIMTHTIAVGPELARTEIQLEALIDYLYHLLHSGQAGKTTAAD